MTKQELIKKYQEIVLKTNGGVGDYVVALCQIANAISELDDQDQQNFYDCPNGELTLEIIKDLITIILQLLKDKNKLQIEKES